MSKQASSTPARRKPTKPERQPVLEYSTLAPERPTVVIDDGTYEYRLLQEFGAIEHQQHSRDGDEYDELWGRIDLNETDTARMETLLNRLFDRVLVDSQKLRDEVGEKLTGAMKRDIVVTFTDAPLLMRVMAQQKAQEETDSRENRSTTAS